MEDTFDPEQIQHDDFSDTEASDNHDEQFNETESRAHYVPIKDSQLRRTQDPSLGPAYIGKPVGRTVIEDYGDDHNSDGAYLSDDPFGSSATPNHLLSTSVIGGGHMVKGNVARTDEMGFDADPVITYANSESVSETVPVEDGWDESASLRGETDGNATSTSEQSEDKAHSGLGGISSRSEAPDRAAYRAIARKGHDHLLESLSKAASADIEKGHAVQNQKRIFQNLLSVRMKLQKGLISSNTIATFKESGDSTTVSMVAIEDAERAALNLLNNINNLRLTFETTPNKERGTKRDHTNFRGGSLPDIYCLIDEVEHPQKQIRRATVNRWAEKTAPMTSLVSTDKLRAAPSRQPLAGVLDGQLSSLSLGKLVSKTRVPRSCAPVQAEVNSKDEKEIYDDADWYALLLRELVESKMSGEGNNPMANSLPDSLPSTAKVNALRREARIRRRNVDVKASKGRKLRYTVQEKIQNFLAPDDRSTWGPKQTRDLFGSLMGRKIQGGLDEGYLAEKDMSPELDEAEQRSIALRLFGTR